MTDALHTPSARRTANNQPGAKLRLLPAAPGREPGEQPAQPRQERAARQMPSTYIKMFLSAQGASMGWVPADHHQVLTPAKGQPRGAGWVWGSWPLFLAARGSCGSALPSCSVRGLGSTASIRGAGLLGWETAPRGQRKASGAGWSAAPRAAGLPCCGSSRQVAP